MVGVRLRRLLIFYSPVQAFWILRDLFFSAGSAGSALKAWTRLRQAVA